MVSKNLKKYFSRETVFVLIKFEVIKIMGNTD